MQKELDEFLRNQPDFQFIKDDIYVFQRDSGIVGLRMNPFYSLNSSLSVGNCFPIVTILFDFADNWCIPVWMKEIEIKTNELFFQVNRMQLLLYNGRRSFNNVIFYYSFLEEWGEHFWQNWTHFDLNNSVDFKRVHLSFIEEAKPYLAAHGYEITTTSIEGLYATITYTYDSTKNKLFYQNRGKGEKRCTKN